MASDGQEALDWLTGTGKYEGRNADERPDLVLLDLKLPKVSGFEVLERMRNDKRTRVVPVVMLTVSTVEPLPLLTPTLASVLLRSSLGEPRILLRSLWDSGSKSMMTWRMRSRRSF